MRERIALAGLLFFFATTAGFNQAAPAASEAEKAPAPQMTISLEHPILRENDALPIHIVISNPSDFDLQNVRLEWSAPANLEFQSSATGSKLPQNAIAIGGVPSQKGSSTTVVKDIWVLSPDIRNEDYNLLFRLSYEWQTKDGLKHGLLTAEKPLKSAFLGTDSFAGVPLALAGFIVPGLLFWLALDWWKTPWRIQGPTLGDKTVYSILVSMLLMAVAVKVPLKEDYFNITQGLSWQKLGALAILGGGVGMVVGFFDRWFRLRRTRRALQQNDDGITLLTKLLRLNVHRTEPKTQVTLTTGQVYQGSVGGQGPTQTFLVGWYRVQPKADRAKQTSQIREALKANEVMLAAKLMRDFGFPLETHDYIYLQARDGTFGTTGNIRMVWPNTDVQGKPTVEVGSGKKPLTME